MHDLIGLSVERIPRFVRSYAETKGTILDAITAWRQDVESRAFPQNQRRWLKKLNRTLRTLNNVEE